MADAPAITLVDDYESAEDFTKKHTPLITVTGGVVTVEVGRDVPHPNGPDHFIGWIELLADGAPIARFDLFPEVTAPKVSLPVSLPAGTTLRAVEHCNLHGLWASEVTL